MSSETSIEALAKELTVPQRYAVKLMTRDWLAGPRLSDAVLDNLDVLRRHGLVEREFADDTPVTITGDIHTELTARVSACWHFRLTRLGLGVKNHLRSGATA